MLAQLASIVPPEIPEYDFFSTRFAYQLSYRPTSATATETIEVCSWTYRDFESKLNQLKLVEMGTKVSKEIDNPQSQVLFLNSILFRIDAETSQEAYVLLLANIAYKANAKAEYAPYYKHSLLYLACVDVATDRTSEERSLRAHDLGISAFLGDTIYNLWEPGKAPSSASTANTVASSCLASTSVPTLPAAIRLGSEIAGNELKIPMSNISETITVMPGDSIHVKKDFFSDKKAYLLVGGLGSLGLQIAQWMYKVRIFLFALIRRGDIVSQRIIAYLESLSDLNLRIEAIDVLCESGTNALAQQLLLCESILVSQR
ncbi:hypothetical protein P692DRAFT_20880543 [Suillus brevipes Sb2]|nr:hypothetical protein P692DRAFT_20880543 [Suillus brevipes Sb2]